MKPKVGSLKSSTKLTNLARPRKNERRFKLLQPGMRKGMLPPVQV